MRKVYPAVIHEEDGQYWVEFPDLEGCFSDGETLADAIANASEALGMYLCSLADRKLEIPPASDIASLHPEDGFVSAVITDPTAYKKNTKAVKKTLTIPEWLNVEAESRSINFSQTLQEALLNKIGLA